MEPRHRSCKAAKLVCLALMAFLLLGAALAPAVSRTEPVTADETAVTFPDPGLERAVRLALDKAAGDIYVSDLEALDRLDTGSRDISDLTGLEHCTSLWYLDLWHNKIGDISPLANLTSLSELDLWQNEISDISPLAGLTSLTELRLSSNQIGDISPLAGLTSLEDLSLGSNEIGDISHLASLTSLEDLYLGYNQTIDISPLANLTSLEYLYLAHNKISDISPLARLTGLTELYLSRNRISDISHLAGLTSLEDITLAHNKISDISVLENLTHLGHPLDSTIHLRLDGNRIADILPLVNNPAFAERDRINLRGNPLSPTSVNDYIPQLEARGVDVRWDTMAEAGACGCSSGAEAASASELLIGWAIVGLCGGGCHLANRLRRRRKR